MANAHDGGRTGMLLGSTAAACSAASVYTMCQSWRYYMIYAFSVR